MRTLGIILVVIGIIIAAFGILNHFSAIVKSGTSHIDIIIAAVGIVVLIVGALLAFMMGRSSAA